MWSTRALDHTIASVIAYRTSSAELARRYGTEGRLRCVRFGEAGRDLIVSKSCMEGAQ